MQCAQVHTNDLRKKNAENSGGVCRSKLNNSAGEKCKYIQTTVEKLWGKSVDGKCGIISSTLITIQNK